MRAGRGRRSVPAGRGLNSRWPLSLTRYCMHMRPAGLNSRWRWIKGMVQVVMLIAFAVLAAVVVVMPNRGIRFTGLLVTLYANYQAAWLLVALCVLWAPRSMTAR